MSDEVIKFVILLVTDIADVIVIVAVESVLVKVIVAMLLEMMLQRLRELRLTLWS